MSEEHVSRPGMCEAYGCPMFGSYGRDGRWWCICHYHADMLRAQAITHLLRRNKTLVHAALQARTDRQSVAAITTAEAQLLELVANVEPMPIPPKKVDVPIPTSEPGYHPYADGSEH